jgi:hypothetical protein
MAVRPTGASRTRWVRRWQRHDTLSTVVWLLAWAAALVLAFGIALTWSRVAADTTTVHAVLRAGGWLATPFHGVFTGADARVRLTENWVLAGAVYLVAGRVLAWLLRW